jgi:hypothetical protein
MKNYSLVGYNFNPIVIIEDFGQMYLPGLAWKNQIVAE